MKPSVFVLFTASALTSCLYGATYSNDFDSIPRWTDMATQTGWSVNDPTDQYSTVDTLNVNPYQPSLSSHVMILGDASLVTYQPVGNSVILSQDYVGTVGAAAGNHISFDFLLTDSSTANGAFGQRDIFGVSISNGLNNVFSVAFTPDAQSLTPDAEGDIGKWNLSYKVGAGPTVELNMAVFDSAQYHFNLSFTPNADPTKTNFDLTIASAVFDGGGNRIILSDGGVGLAVAPTAVTDKFNVSWTKGDVNGFGSNALVMDNLNVIPEPSSTLLVSLAGLGLALRRRRA